MPRKLLFFLVFASCISCMFSPLAFGQSAPDGLSVKDAAAWQMKAVGNDLMTQLMFLAIRDQPSLLDDKVCLHAFIVQNNEGANYQKVLGLLRSEMEAPALEKYYKQHAAEITAATPTKMKVSSRSVVDTVNGKKTDDTADVGSYDMSTHSFSWVDHSGNLATGDISSVGTQNESLRQGNGGLDAFQLTFQDIQITQVKVDEDAARAFSMMPGNGEGNGGNGRTRRSVALVMDFEVPPGTVEVEQLNQLDKGVTFKAKLIHMDVISPTNKVLATIYP